MINGVIVVDKPAGWTSHDVVAKLRAVMKERRVGHGGTLDPMATGVLPIFVGRATRAAAMVTDSEKEYVAGLRMGLTTDTQDITGTVLRQSDMIPDSSAAKEALKYFVGEIMQVPPMYSAIKKDGKKLYELARQGIEVPRQARPVNISKISLVPINRTDYEMTVRCSKGTYIRTLCHDLGQRLGCGAVMTSLRRTAAGGYSLEDATPLETLIKDGPEKYLRGVDGLFKNMPKAVLSDKEEKKVRNGAAFETALPDGVYRVYGKEEFLAVCEAKAGKMKTVKSFFEV